MRTDRPAFRGLARRCAFAVAVLASLAVAGCAGRAGESALPSDIRQCKAPRPQVCTMDFTPVCAARNSEDETTKAGDPTIEWMTFSNACSACGDARVLGYRRGACQSDPANDS